jgi:predicted enzyme related to lactoylglutathione lyase
MVRPRDFGGVRGIADAARAAARAARLAAKSAVRAAELARNAPGTTIRGDFAFEVAVADARRSLDFYTGALGYTVEELLETDGRLAGARLRSGKSRLAFHEEPDAARRSGAKGAGFVVFTETAEDLDVLAERVRTHGGRVVSGPEASELGGRSLTFEDPDGYRQTWWRPGAGRD